MTIAEGAVSDNSEAPIQERVATGMAWAVERPTGKPIYVGKLGGDRVGLKCECVCPACDAPLQAVGVGETSNRARAPFFRHHQAQQGPGCKYRVAELAALKLLAEQGLIQIPAPRKHAVYPGHSGQIYRAEFAGEAIEERIVEQRLISAVEAVLTLASGREIALVLRGHQNVGELGSVYAVVEIHVSDPEVAMMSPDEIVAHAGLRGQWLHLIRHRDDDKLQRLAEEEARARALSQLDINPAELDLPPGATKKQASESILHWAIKSALMHVGKLAVPEHRELVSAVGRDGELHTAEVFLPAASLKISDVRDELLFEGFRPDITCRAEGGAYGPVPLLVEVAVTSKVTQTKLGLIRSDNIACVEIDTQRFAQGGQVGLAQLPELVANDLSCKTWLHHPELPRLRVEAQAAADASRDEADARKAAAAQAAIEAQRREDARRRAEEQAAQRKFDWAQGLGRDEALGELRILLERRWEGELQLSSNGMRWTDDEFERSVTGVVRGPLLVHAFTASRGIAWRLSYLARAGRDGFESIDLAAVCGSAVGVSSWTLEPWQGLFHLAIDHFAVPVARHQAATFAEQHEKVISSLQAGQRTYCRPEGLDEALAAMYPELATVLQLPLGTVSHAQEVARRREERQAAARAAAIEAANVAEAELQLRNAAEAALEAARRAAAAVQEVGLRWRWRSSQAIPRSAEQAVANLAFTGIKQPSESVVELVKAGWVACRDGQDLGTWFSSRDFASEDAVAHARSVLEGAFLICLGK